MDYLQRYKRQFHGRLALMLLANNLLLLVVWFVTSQLFHLKPVIALCISLVPAIVTLLVLPPFMTKTLTIPTELLWQAILHIAPATANSVGAPTPENAKFGRELVTNLVQQLYQIATVVDSLEKKSVRASQDLHANFVANSLPLPLIVLNKDDKIVYINDTATIYTGKQVTELVGQNVYTALDMSFTSEDTLYGWLKSTKGQSVTANHKWDRVRIGLPGQRDSLLFDMAGYYNQGNSLGYETLLVLFDHTEVYSQDDQAMSFVALSVHELRTPLTLLRGYIEVFDEELGPTLNSELKAFMRKMDAAAQQLAAFVDNILNVARIEDNQLTLQLHEESWPNVVQTVVHDLNLRAGVRGITIKTDVAPNLPTVGVDRYSIYEVLANLLDNAIKYSKGTTEIYVTARLNENGQVETSVKDFGLGIDASILPHVFDKFYRNHRNRAQIGGTGLGLYLCKSIVDAHGGQISVSSKVNEGSTFTFTLLPFDQLAGAGMTGTKTGITRSAHGWIKNHSLYRD